MPFSFLAFVRCAHTDKDESTAPTYQQCVDKQEDLRKSHYLKMPEFFRQSVAGSHPIVKYYPYSPSAKELSSDVKKLDGENSFIDARKEEGTQNKDPLLSDNSPARNRIFFNSRDRRTTVLEIRKMLFFCGPIMVLPKSFTAAHLKTLNKKLVFGAVSLRVSFRQLKR